MEFKFAESQFSTLLLNNIELKSGIILGFIDREQGASKILVSTIFVGLEDLNLDFLIFVSSAHILD